MSRIYINGRFLSQTRSGTQRFAEEIVTNLDKLLETDQFPEVVLCIPPNTQRHLELSNIVIKKVGTSASHAWEQIDLYKESRNGILLNLINSAPILHPRSLVTLHDASIYDKPELFSLKYRVFHKIMRPYIARRSLKTITVSNFSKQRLMELMKLPEDRFAVIPNGCDHIMRVEADPSILCTNGLESRRYILCVGNASPNKNIIAAFKASSALNIEGVKFVSVGMVDNRVFGNLAKEELQIKCLRGVDDAALRSLYENAAVFAFPSKYEGFGIPPLEAMALECPVICSKAGAIPETVGDAAILVNPEDTVSFTDAMRTIITDDLTRTKYVSRGTKRAARYKWRTSSEKLAKILMEEYAKHF